MHDERMHTDLYFDIQAKVSEEVAGGPLLRRIKEVGGSRAGAALRAYWALSSLDTDLIPGARVGRMHVPEHKLADLNRLEEEGDPMPCALIRCEDGERQHFLQVFTDRTALVLTREDPANCTRDLPLLSVLPIVLKLSSPLNITGYTLPVQMSVIEESGRFANIKYRLSDEHADPRNLCDPNVSNHLTSLVRDAIALCLDQEVSLWGRQIARLPFLIDQTDGPACGIFGRDLPAPSGDADGQPFAVPPALPWVNFSIKSYKAAQRFAQLAWAHLLETVIPDAERGILDVNCASPRQDRADATISISATDVVIPGVPTKSADRRVREAFAELLRHPKAPPGLFRMTGCGRTDVVAGGRQKLQPYTIFQGVIGRDIPSAHDRLSAHAIFGRGSSA